ncbi:MAG: hypothetical protein EOP49_08875 [Sphingobacteriales bacterium]|nr:MAG: hypothetical protein EOP49_08875 [Sphingobacteriales bacterium]
MNTTDAEEILSFLESEYADLLSEDADREVLTVAWSLIQHYRQVLTEKNGAQPAFPTSTPPHTFR